MHQPHSLRKCDEPSGPLYTFQRSWTSIHLKRRVLHGNQLHRRNRRVWRKACKGNFQVWHSWSASTLRSHSRSNLSRQFYRSRRQDILCLPRRRRIPGNLGSRATYIPETEDLWDSFLKRENEYQGWRSKRFDLTGKAEDSDFWSKPDSVSSACGGACWGGPWSECWCWIWRLSRTWFDCWRRVSKSFPRRCFCIVWFYTQNLFWASRRNHSRWQGTWRNN